MPHQFQYWIVQFCLSHSYIQYVEIDRIIGQQHILMLTILRFQKHNSVLMNPNLRSTIWHLRNNMAYHWTQLCYTSHHKPPIPSHWSDNSIATFWRCIALRSPTPLSYYKRSKTWKLPPSKTAISTLDIEIDILSLSVPKSYIVIVMRWVLHISSRC